jgi:hypothetical protein
MKQGPCPPSPSETVDSTSADSTLALTNNESCSQSDLAAAEDHTVSGLRVLLVEDNIINQKVGKRMLATLGCQATVRACRLSLLFVRVRAC